MCGRHGQLVSELGSEKHSALPLVVCALDRCQLLRKDHNTWYAWFQYLQAHFTYGVNVASAFNLPACTLLQPYMAYIHSPQARRLIHLQATRTLYGFLPNPSCVAALHDFAGYTSRLWYTT